MTNEELIDILLQVIPKSSTQPAGIALPDVSSSLAGTQAGPAASISDEVKRVTAGSALADQLAVMSRELALGRWVGQPEGNARVTAASDGFAETVLKAIGGGLAGGIDASKGPVSKSFGLFGAIAGLKRLIGSRQEADPELPSYVAPPAINVETGLDSAGSLQPVSRGVGDRPRMIAGELPPIPSVTIQVNAMDSRSFMDHSNEIAKAVREAMLSGHSLNDVFTE
jgi:hypothetical protein